MSGYSVVPPPRPPKIEIDPAEFLAMKAVIMSLVGALAIEGAERLIGSGQPLVNSLSEIAQDLIRGMEISAGRQSEPLRQEAIDHVNSFLKITHLHGGGRDEV